MQVCSDSFISLTQIQPISLTFVLTHSEPCNLTQICSAPCRFTQIRSDSQDCSESHSDSLDLVQKCSDPFRHTQIHSDSHSFIPDSFCFPQTHPDSLRFTQTYIWGECSCSLFGRDDGGMPVLFCPIQHIDTVGLHTGRG